MKKIIISLLIIIILLLIPLIFTNKEDNSIKKIKVAEVTHSAFYSPLYVAIENGYFKEEGLDIELILTPGADKVSSAVLSNDVEIGFAGIESALYIYQGGEKDFLKVFSGLTKKDGQFIVSRKKIDNFSLNDLKGKEILVGRKGGMPAINFLNALKVSNIDPKDININYSIDFSALSGSFSGNIGDFVNLFEPNATSLEKENIGYIVANIGDLSNDVPYTTFYARNSYIKNNTDIIIKFTKAIKKGLEYVHNNSSKDIAKIIWPQFKDISLKDLEKIVDNYKKYDSWYYNSFIPENDFLNIENMLIENNLLKAKIPYDEIIVNYE